ncbi:sugar transferase [Filobacillus milosensis]|uniref:Sugar transferase n=1 Tax=Filobacillus milosensis TaxID=94137 RepID=A0A4Y8IKR3_9BACI|nr:sugar transferase [Filobacillus milosensis]TFB14169.1 sugar transferase [Filobacillus milosensis]
MYKIYIKRLIDIILSLLALIILSPIILIITVLVRVKLGSPVLFKQQRPGLNELIFTMYKFRTMTNEKDKNGNLLPDHIRLTKFGRFLRSTSLDELPELFNIIKGDMSIVGPRPQLVRDMVFMSNNQRQRHSVKPGLTGWAQINGRNNLSWENKLNLDLDYISQISFSMDIKIIFLTLLKVFKKEDVNTEGMDTAEDLGDYLLRIGKIDSTEYEQKMNQSQILLGNKKVG